MNVCQRQRRQRRRVVGHSAGWDKRKGGGAKRKDSEVRAGVGWLG